MTKVNVDKFKKILDQDDRIFFTVGIHPNRCRAYRKPEHEPSFLDLIKHERCVAIGECGFNFRDRNGIPIETQIIFFEKCLRFANEFKKPLVIHLRDLNDEEFQITLNLLLRHLDKSHKIYLHAAGKFPFKFCRKLVDQLPNLYLGFNPGTIAVDRLPSFYREDRYLLESNAPKLKPQVIESPNFSIPHFVFFAAQEIASKTGRSIDQVITQNNENSYRFYEFSTIVLVQNVSRPKSKPIVSVQNLSGPKPKPIYPIEIVSRSEQQKKTSIYCTDVPSCLCDDFLYLEIHFEQFGVVTDTQFYAESKTAVVTFDSRESAVKAATKGRILFDEPNSPCFGGIHVLLDSSEVESLSLELNKLMLN